MASFNGYIIDPSAAFAYGLAGNFTFFAYILPPQFEVDSNAPDIDAAPPDSSAITQGQTIQVDIIDPSSDIVFFAATAIYPGFDEPVHDGTVLPQASAGFGERFKTNSTIEVIHSPHLAYRLYLNRDGGWPFNAAPLIRVHAVDKFGNVS